MGATIAFFVMYLLIVIVIGWLSSRKESEDDFMIASRNVSGIQVAATMSAGFFDGAILAVYMAYLYQYGASAIWVFVGMALGFVLLNRYAQRIKRQADAMNVYSMPEYFYKLFGKKNGLLFSLFLILQFFLLLTVNLIMSGKVLSLLFPISYAFAVLIGGLIILTYLLLAGFRAVVRTDFFQLMIMILMSVGVFVVFFGKTVTIPATDWNFGAMGIGNILGFLILSSMGMMVAPDLWQRIYATKDKHALRKGLLYGAAILLVLGVLISTIGLVTKQAFPNILPEDALVTGFSNLLPASLTALGMVLLYAVTLSSSDTATFVVSSILTRDLKNYTKRYRKESMKWLTRVSMVLFVLCAVGLGVVYTNVLALGFSFSSLNLALFPVVFGSFHWKLKPTAVFWSLILAFVSVAVLFAMNRLNPQTAVVCLPVGALSLIILQKLLK